jgi:molybdate transport system substrate-binding protein
MKKLLSVVLVAALCAATLAGCRKKQEPVTLNIFAAASLTESLNEIAALYKANNPAVTLSFNYDSSGKLQTQIENGAEADLFISAAVKQMNTLVDGGFVDTATKKDLLLNRVVLIVPGNSSKGIVSYNDVSTDKVSLIALGNSAVPCGQYAEEIFKSLGIWDAIQSKISFGDNVKEILSQVESASVDAGVVYSTDVATAKGDVKIAADAPAGSHAPVVYPAAVLKNTKDSNAAKAFLAYLSAPEAVAVFEKIGFTMAK